MNLNNPASEQDHTVLETILTPQESLAAALTDTMGYAICHVELGIEQGSSGQRDFARAKRLCDRGMTELNMLLFLTHALRDYIRAHLNAISVKPTKHKLEYFRPAASIVPPQEAKADGHALRGE